MNRAALNVRKKRLERELAEVEAELAKPKDVVLLEGGPRGGETFRLTAPGRPLRFTVMGNRGGIMFAEAVYLPDELHEGVYRFSPKDSPGVKDANHERPEASLRLKDHEMYRALSAAGLNMDEGTEKIAQAFIAAVEKNYAEFGTSPKVVYLTLEIEMS